MSCPDKPNSLRRRDFRDFLVPILSVLILVAIVSGCSRQDELRVGTDPSYPPFESVDSENDEVEGLDIDIAEYIIEHAEKEMVVEEIEYESLFSALDSEKIDMAISAIPITEAGKRRVDFSEPYYEASTAVMVRRGSDIKSKEDLQGLRAGVATSSSATEDAEEYGEALIEFSTRLEAVEALRAEKVDCVFIEEEPGQLFAQINQDIILLPIGFPIEYYGIAVKEGNESLLETINSAIAELKASGKYDSLIKEHLR